MHREIGAVKGAICIKNKTLLSLVLVAVIFALSATYAFAFEKDRNSDGMENGEKLSDAQREDIWKSLSENEKKELYALFEKRSQADREIIKMFAKMGLLTQAESEKILKKIDEKTSEIIKSDTLPIKEHGCHRKK